MLRGGLLAGAVTLTLAGCGEQDPEQWRVALEETSGGVQHEYAKRFAQEVEERTEGAVEVSIYPYGALGDTQAVHKQLRDNAVHFAFGSSDLAQWVPEHQLFDLHYVLSDDPAVNTWALNDPELLWSDTLQQAYRDERMQLLSVVPQGWRVWSSDAPLTRPAAFEGVRVATAESPMQQESLRVYGAQAVPVEQGGLYEALADGAADVTELSWSRHREVGTYEFHREYTVAEHAPYLSAFLASRWFYDRLSRSERALLREITEDLLEWSYQMQQTVNEDQRAEIEEIANVNQATLDPEEQEAFRDLARPLRAIFTSRVGGDAERLLERLLDAVDRAEEEHGG